MAVNKIWQTTTPKKKMEADLAMEPTCVKQNHEPTRNSVGGSTLCWELRYEMETFPISEENIQKLN